MNISQHFIDYQAALDLGAFSTLGDEDEPVCGCAALRPRSPRTRRPSINTMVRIAKRNGVVLVVDERFKFLPDGSGPFAIDMGSNEWDQELINGKN